VAGIVLIYFKNILIKNLPFSGKRFIFVVGKMITVSHSRNNIVEKKEALC